MAKREIQNLDLKIKYTLEYIENGGIERIFDPLLLQSLQMAKFDADGNADPDSITPNLNTFMMGVLMQHSKPPFYSSEHISEYASLLQKDLLFDQEKIDTEEEFDRVYEEYNKKENILFRGQREAKWRLYNKLQRQWILEKLYGVGFDYRTFLETLVSGGLAEYADKIKELLEKHHIDTNNDIAVLGFLQHHGCPTPLLDWTFKFQNALYFGIDGLTPKEKKIEIDDYFSVYYLEETLFEEGSMRRIMTDSLDKIGEEILENMINGIAKDEDTLTEMQGKFRGRKVFDRSKYEGSGMVKDLTKIEKIITFPLLYFSDRDAESGIIFSLNNSKNILNQDGVFIWNADQSKPLEVVGYDLYASDKESIQPREYAFCKCFNINKNLENHIRKRLEADGITKEFIYPTSDINTYPIFENSKQTLTKS